jgi:hypothetical protein
MARRLTGIFLFLSFFRHNINKEMLIRALFTKEHKHYLRAQLGLEPTKFNYN